MIENVLGRLRCEKLIRMDVDMRFIKKNFDTMIGRAAHIALISDPIVLDTIAYRFGEYL